MTDPSDQDQPTEEHDVQAAWAEEQAEAKIAAHPTAESVDAEQPDAEPCEGNPESMAGPNNDAA